MGRVFRQNSFPGCSTSFIAVTLPAPRPGKGSGLGLAVVKKAIEEMGGSVRAENEETSGLRIMFTLPLAKEDSHAENSDR